jgi:4-azaleucine resistance transporter AzlC
MTSITWTDRGFSLAGARRGVRRTIPIGVTVVVYGTVFGALAAQAGLSPLESVLMSGLVFAGGAQFIVLELWDTPLPIVALVLTTLVVNLRLLLMGATLSGWLKGLRPARKALLATFISDESWALTTRAREDGESDRAFLVGSGLILFVAWVGATALGASTGSLIDDPAALDVARRLLARPGRARPVAPRGCGGAGRRATGGRALVHPCRRARRERLGSVAR